MSIYIDIVMSSLETISTMSKCGYTDRELSEYIDKKYEIECELNGEEHKDPKKPDRYFCMGCKFRKMITMKGRFWYAPNVEYLSTILFMCHHTII